MSIGKKMCARFLQPIVFSKETWEANERERISVKIKDSRQVKLEASAKVNTERERERGRQRGKCETILYKVSGAYENGFFSFVVAPNVTRRQHRTPNMEANFENIFEQWAELSQSNANKAESRKESSSNGKKELKANIKK